MDWTVVAVAKREERGLRSGYTTGTCAAAAAKAATLTLLNGESDPHMNIDLPIGRTAWIPIHAWTVEAESARCCVIKDAGDDPDVTHGAEICAGLFGDIAGGEIYITRRHSGESRRLIFRPRFQHRVD